ncbi:MAG TPA: hypothetical protein VN328_02035, partial [Thermodesulfovibrionales bacterium]|nr:hypothetical protein [Thermodesulfovibrionales bacterium]
MLRLARLDMPGAMHHVMIRKHNRAGRSIGKIIKEEYRRSGINRLELGGGGKRRVVSGPRAALA